MSEDAWKALFAVRDAKLSGSKVPPVLVNVLSELAAHGLAVDSLYGVQLTDTGNAVADNYRQVAFGKYRTERDGGIEYTYQAFWQLRGESVDWYAVVHRGREYAGNPAGNILNASRLGNIEAQVRALVENSIEMRASVQ